MLTIFDPIYRKTFYLVTVITVLFKQQYDLYGLQMLDFINVHYLRSLIEIDKKSFDEISTILKNLHPDEKGLSVRNLKRFCAEHDIRHRQGASDEVVRELISQSIKQVNF